ncbi:MAG: hypothetical protein NTX25_24105, partial [Proteobacteria bacterium]|nr:hypothetical protein [Pseudomonadota bacterium]
LCMMTANLEISQEEKAMLNILSLTFKLSYKKTLLLHTRHYLDSGLRGLEDSLRFMPAQLNTAHHSLHRFQDALSELGIVPLNQIVASGKAYLESMEPMKLPKDAPTEIKVAALSLVGNAMRLDNIFDEAEKAFLQKTMHELGLKGEDLKAHTHIMKESSVADLCAILKIWAMAKNNTVSLSAVGYFVLRAISADGVIDEKEDKFKTLFFKELGLDPAQYLRILLRAQLDLVE